MHVFKQAPRDANRTHRPAAASSTHAAPERYGRSSHQTTSVARPTDSSRSMVSPGGTHSYQWGEQPVAVSTTYDMTTGGGPFPGMPNAPFAETQMPNVPSSSYHGSNSAAASSASRWCLVVNGQNQSPLYLPADRFQIPRSRCICGTPFRFVHLPTIGAMPTWQPEVGVLWNFVVANEGSGWMEGHSNAAFVSQVSCPVCTASICLFGPY